MKSLNYIGMRAGLAMMACVVGLSTANAQFVREWNAADGNYATPSNWDPFQSATTPGLFIAPPEARYGESASIANGGIARVTGFVPDANNEGNEAAPGGVNISSGTLAIESAGQLRVVPGMFAGESVFGATSVGSNGTLSKQSGGVFETTSLSLNGTLQLGITSSGLNAIDVTNTATLGGSLQIDFTGFTPSETETWSLIEANAFTGAFGTISTTGIDVSPSQLIGLRQVPLVGGRTSLELFVDQLLTLEVDRVSGDVSLFSTGSSVAIDSYTITSNSGVLDDTDAVFNSLGEQLPGSTWRESNTSANQIAELRQNGTTLIDGTGFSLGAVYAPPAPTAFREGLSAAQDLVFQYSAPDGVIRTGFVEYTGNVVNDLLLTVDPTDGRVELSNPSGFDVAIEAYSISSASGALTPGGWTSLDDLDGPGNEDGGWRESNPSTNFMGELLQTGEQMMVNGTRFQLGSIYDFAGAAEDLVFEFLLAGESQGLVGTILYLDLPEPGSLLGDYNVDGVVDAADYTVWRDNLNGDSAALNGNGSGGPTVTSADYALWRSHFGETSGSLATASGSNVPEPSSLVLVSLLLAGIAFRSRR